MTQALAAKRLVLSMHAARVLLAILLAACSGSVAPAVAPGQTAVVGEAVFSRRGDGAISVTVTHTFEGHTASGTAVLQNMDLETAKRSVLVRVAETRAWIAITEDLESDPPRRYLAAQRAVDELGTEYRKTCPSLADDTGKLVQVARGLSDQGNDVAAADELVRAARSRLALYLRCFHDNLGD